MNGLSYGVRMWTQASLHGQTDGRTERPRKYSALHYMQPHGKNENLLKLDDRFLQMYVVALFL